MFILCHKIFRRTKLPNHQILLGAGHHSKGPEIVGEAGAAATLEAAATVAEYPGVSAPI